MEFVLNGESLTLDKARVEGAMSTVTPEEVRQHGVRIGGVVYPVKQAFSVATGLPRHEFTSHTALRLLARFGFEVIGEVSHREQSDSQPSSRKPVVTHVAPDVDARGWPWEGQVQSLFAAYLHSNGWLVTAMADTATKAQGVDVLAHKGARNLGAEVKGWPSRSYADPRRSEEVKPTQPSTQAGHWFSQAVVKALMLLDSHPGYESLVVLPDYPRYRDLAARTRTGLHAADVQVAFVQADGMVTSDTWTP